MQHRHRTEGTQIQKMSNNKKGTLPNMKASIYTILVTRRWRELNCQKQRATMHTKTSSIEIPHRRTTQRTPPKKKGVNGHTARPSLLVQAKYGTEFLVLTLLQVKRTYRPIRGPISLQSIYTKWAPTPVRRYRDSNEVVVPQ